MNYRERFAKGKTERQARRDCSSRRARSPASASGAATSTTRAASRSPTSTRRWRPASRASTRRSPASAAARMRRARAATRRARTSRSCSRAWASTPASTSTALLALRAQGRAAGSKASRCTARSGAPACRRPSPHDARRSATRCRHAMNASTAAPACPSTGMRVVEFTHMVMGPTCGMILADLGAEVIKVEPPGGDKTRKLPGLGHRLLPHRSTATRRASCSTSPARGPRAPRVELIGQLRRRCSRTSGPA